MYKSQYTLYPSSIVGCKCTVAYIEKCGCHLSFPFYIYGNKITNGKYSAFCIYESNLKIFNLKIRLMWIGLPNWIVHYNKNHFIIIAFSVFIIQSDFRVIIWNFYYFFRFDTKIKTLHVITKPFRIVISKWTMDNIANTIFTLGIVQ